MRKGDKIEFRCHQGSKRWTETETFIRKGRYHGRAVLYVLEDGDEDHQLMVELSEVLKVNGEMVSK